MVPRLQYLFIDAREPAAVVRVQRLLRSLVKRHRRYRKELDAFRSLCKQAAVAAAEGRVESSLPSVQVAQLVASRKGATDEGTRAGEVLTKASLQKKKPLRILIVGVPNVGKSKIANCLAGRKVARSYRWPGTTQSVNVSHLHAVSCSPLSLFRATQYFLCKECQTGGETNTNSRVACELRVLCSCTDNQLPGLEWAICRGFSM